jgi:hypothetical protein
MSCSHEIFRLRKEHKLDEALAKVRECYAADTDDLWLQRAYGWVLYDLVKHEVDAFAENDASPGHCRCSNSLGPVSCVRLSATA